MVKFRICYQSWEHRPYQMDWTGCVRAREGARLTPPAARSGVVTFKKLGRKRGETDLERMINNSILDISEAYNI